jgi:hypothetical protein
MPKPKPIVPRQNVTASVPLPLRERIEQLATAQRTSLSAVVGQLLAAALPEERQAA